MNYLEIKGMVAKDFENYQSRYMHMLEVVDMALKINKHFNFNLDEEKIKIVGILHDYTKRYSFEESLEIIKVLPKEEQESTRHNLLKYCELDTYAMVKVWEELRRVV